MKWIASALFVVSFLLVGGCFGSRILGIMPIVSKSHWAVGSSVLKALGEAGHEVTIISPFTLPNTKNANYTTIHLTDMVEKFNKIVAPNVMNNWMVKVPGMALPMISQMGFTCAEAVFDDEGVKQLLNDKTQKFDLIVMEDFGTRALAGFGDHYNAPVISVFGSVPARFINSLVGNPELPAYVPNMFLSYTPQMNLFQRVNNFFIGLVEDLVFEYFGMKSQSELYEKNFPHHKKSLKQVLKEDVALTFVNTHFSLAYPRPNVPNMIEIGGINIDRTIGKLPQEFQEFLDSASEHGVILFSMGSFLQASDFSPEQRASLISAFGKLKQKVIWRYNLPDSDQLPKNILTKDWLPQKEIMAHPNVKLFMTHGGMLGTTESVYHGKPMVGIPVFGDQQLNIARAVNRGYAVQLDLNALTESSILSAVQEILNNPAYSKRAKELSSILKDQPMTPKEAVVYWSEYVMRHKGARHMQVEGQNMGFIAYHGLDVYFILLVAVLLFGVLPSYLIIRWTVRKCKGKKSQKIEKKKN